MRKLPFGGATEMRDKMLEMLSVTHRACSRNRSYWNYYDLASASNGKPLLVSGGIIAEQGFEETNAVM